jgi:hypothetical protein
LEERVRTQQVPWKPVLNPGVSLLGLPLTPEEGFLASRLDGITDLHGLSIVTGLSPQRIEAGLERLVSLGAVSAPEVLGEGEPAAGDEPAGMHRKLYETVLHQLAAEERAARRMPACVEGSCAIRNSRPACCAACMAAGDCSSSTSLSCRGMYRSRPAELLESCCARGSRLQKRRSGWRYSSRPKVAAYRRSPGCPSTGRRPPSSAAGRTARRCWYKTCRAGPRVRLS